MSKIKALQDYVDKVKNSLSTSTGPKKEFWERELRKTNAKIQELSK